LSGCRNGTPIKIHGKQCAHTYLHPPPLLQLQLSAAPRGNDHMNDISDKIKSGARAFLVTEYKYLTIFVFFVCVILVILYTVDPPSGDETDGVRYAACFLCGAFLSGAAGWGGMAVATVSTIV